MTLGPSGRPFARRCGRSAVIRSFGPLPRPWDGCEIQGGYGHLWPDRNDSHSAVEIPLTKKGRRFFEVLSATQTSRIDAAIAALPADGKRTVLKFFVGMVEPGDRATLDRLKLTEDLPQK